MLTSVKSFEYVTHVTSMSKDGAKMAAPDLTRLSNANSREHTSKIYFFKVLYHRVQSVQVEDACSHLSILS